MSTQWQTLKQSVNHWDGESVFNAIKKLDYANLNADDSRDIEVNYFLRANYDPKFDNYMGQAKELYKRGMDKAHKKPFHKF